MPRRSVSALRPCEFDDAAHLWVGLYGAGCLLDGYWCVLCCRGLSSAAKLFSPANCSLTAVGLCRRASRLTPIQQLLFKEYAY
jgi:hypothetical protein